MLVALLLAAAPCVRAQDARSPMAAADSTATALPAGTDATDASCALVAGTWHYSAPAVHAQGSSLVGKLGKPIAKSKLKKKLNKAFNKLKIKKRWQALELTAQGKWHLSVTGLSMGGNYTFDPLTSRLTLKWHGIPLHAQALREGDHLHLLLDTDRLLTLLRWVSGISHNDTLKAIAFLSSNYHDVKVGFDLKSGG